jgi:glutathione synthase/RimK-type ligase-like ATP-grasp enzyme
VAVLRNRRLPRFVTWEIPDVDALHDDDRRLVAELTARGADVTWIAWDEPLDWDRFDVAVLRSTWDYIDAPDTFLSALSRIDESSCRLVNPLDAVRWNGAKTYLADLADLGVPTVPTVLAAEAHTLLAAGAHEVVLKPVVGAGASGVRRVAAPDLDDVLAAERAAGTLDRLLAQPFVPSVQDEGEWSFVHIDRELQHALLKRPAPGDYRAHGIYGGTIEAISPSEDDRSDVDDILRRVPFDIAYSRVDLVRLGGRLAVLELELIEPILYFHLAPASAGRLAQAVLARA